MFYRVIATQIFKKGMEQNFYLHNAQFLIDFTPW